jgi:steroid delta-isomerase-like uncharacterized protein
VAMDIEKWVQGEDAAWASRDVEKILSFYADDVIYEDLAMGKVNHGKEELRAFIKPMLARCPNLKVEMKSFFASGDHLCIQVVLSGTQTGNVPGLPPATGKSFSVRCAHIIELQGDKAGRATDYYDWTTVMRQLGLLPPPPG